MGNGEIKMTERFEKLAAGIGAGIWNIGFSHPEGDWHDETQFGLTDGEGADELWALWDGFCRENGWDPDELAVDYIEEGEED